MSRRGVVLIAPTDPRIAELVAAWPDADRWPYRSRWLSDVEDVLRDECPEATSRTIQWTARSLAPFGLLEQP